MPFASKMEKKLHDAWKDMHRRCTDPKRHDYKDYGGRGIKVCERWQSWPNFRADVGIPAPGLYMDRVDVNGDYAPENHRWTTASGSTNNRRCTLKVQGEPLSKVAKRLGMTYTEARAFFGFFRRSFRITRKRG